MATIKKQSDGRYRARYTGPDGKERGRIFGKKKDAEAWIAMQTGKIHAGDGSRRPRTS